MKLGAILFTIGLFTGLWTALALADFIRIPLPHLALAAHLNGLIGGLWLIAVGLSIPFLSYKEKQLNVLCWSSCIPAFGNWFITLIASLWGVRGLLYNENPKNNIIAFLLQFFVVLPSLFAGIYWIKGFSTPKKK